MIRVCDILDALGEVNPDQPISEVLEIGGDVAEINEIPIKLRIINEPEPPVDVEFHNVTFEDGALIINAEA